MKRTPQPLDKLAISTPEKKGTSKIGLVLSGGGSRAAYQVGDLKALLPYIDEKDEPISVVVGSSIGAVNGIALSACLKQGLAYAVGKIEEMWLERTFRNTFHGSPSMAFFRSVKVAILRYARNPGPHATNEAIFDPTPLMQRVDSVIDAHGGLLPENRAAQLKGVAVMTTIEGKERKPLLFLSSNEKLDKERMNGASFEVCHVPMLSAKHGFASAALPTVLPPVELDVEGGRIKLVDGGISQNVPVDPAVRMGADKVIVVDVSGRQWWLDRYGEPHDKRPDWEVPAGLETYCFLPPQLFVCKTKKALGPVLRDSVGRNNRDFIQALGPVWPIFSLIKKKLGEDLAYEVLSYIALHPEYSRAAIEAGYNETAALLRKRRELIFKRAVYDGAESEEE